MQRQSARKRKPTYQIKDGDAAVKTKLPKVPVPVSIQQSMAQQSAISVPTPVNVNADPTGVFPVYQLQQFQSVVLPVGTSEQAIGNDTLPSV